MQLHLNNTFTTELKADTDKQNMPRQVYDAFYSEAIPRKPSKPTLIHYSEAMMHAIGLNEEEVNLQDFTSVFTGKTLLENSTPYAMRYGGHQFGNWAGQLGDGRAINLGEVVNNNQRWALQLKGAGVTPYSRTADGLAVLRSSIREYLCSEAMHYLGVPTTRALSICLTGDEVLRDVMYDGHPAYEKGAVVARVAPSFIRFGNFEILSATDEIDNLKALADYTIKHFYSHIKNTGKEAYIQWFKEVAANSLEMVMHWQRVGFVHGVMNTDNMSILGLTIDYGPYGWLEDYNPNWTPNTTDRQNRRYRFGNQPKVVQWNLYQLANALFPLIEEAAPLEAVLNNYSKTYEKKYLQMMGSKLGLSFCEDNDVFLIESLEENLQLSETDMTIFFRKLAEVNSSNVDNAVEIVHEAFYNIEEIGGVTLQNWENWFRNYAKRLALEKPSNAERIVLMNRVNPKYVLRNYMAQLVIDNANKGDYGLLNEIFGLLQKPYDEQSQYQKWFAKRPDWARHKVGCSMLSCSS